MPTLHSITPSAVLPAGEPSLAGRCPASSRITAANRKRRRRPFPTFKTPHERALDENGVANLRSAREGGDRFFEDFAEGVGRKGKSAGSGK